MAQCEVSFNAKCGSMRGIAKCKAWLNANLIAEAEKCNGPDDK